MEISGEQQPKSQGQRWLELIGREEHLGKETGYVNYKDGTDLLTDDFYLVCYDHAAPLFTELEQTPEDDPKYHERLKACQNLFDYYFVPDPDA